MAAKTKKQLQEEIDLLRKQLYLVVYTPRSIAAREIIVSLKTQRDLESRIWYGKPYGSGKGIIAQIKKANE